MIKGTATDETVIGMALEFCEATSKQPIRCKDSFGFAINRFFCPYTNAAVGALEPFETEQSVIDEAGVHFLVRRRVVRLHCLDRRICRWCRRLA